ncbi:MAG: hypothetical protein GDA56_16825 [Hormoscilla sp. GM7CHS1pb]|nr:hypothetical protein [Hormoscilla sp. GM7CHS1pb]
MNVLTPEQEALIPVYQEKWQAISLSTESIDREKAAAAVKAVYGAMGKKAPLIRFCSSPYEAMRLELESETREETQIPVNLWARLFAQLCQIIRWQQRRQNNSLQKLIAQRGASHNCNWKNQRLSTCEGASNCFYREK